MSEYTIFPNAPIVEAVLDIRVELPKDVTLDTLEMFYDKIKVRYPEKQHRTELSAGIRLDPQGASFEKPEASQTGYLFRSQVEKKVVQSRLNGFSFNKLKPYSDWNTFRSEGRELWDIYRKIVKPLKITRIELRYINRIEMPLPLKDFKEYILTVPEVAPELPQALAHFFMRLVIPKPDTGAVAVINQTMEIPEGGGQRLPFIFDIDVFKETSYSGDEENMWKEFDELRDFKNEVFFKSITEQAKELFK
ncbi:MAG: TIGR04255 family protein [Syntrophobacterales bacterium CG_4_8_14_3_um_filter_49_14]|nr:MAG: TIGR04255 family protein [Syntrophobacteraceae bacterium CG23_combo_of_CG06-09_8_20_14_all_50_8]PJC75054.1 MAG: TIGR04255 family protein [Syntrophobacterales bacterium CG_4_8_14_3_um_filter_49_14]